jgi:hypothetical protein
MKRARLTKGGRFLGKGDFKAKGYLGSGGLARFRDTLWIAAASHTTVPSRLSADKLTELASASRARIKSHLRPRNAD